MEQSSNLTGKLLIAMPGMLDPRFERSVILVCSHTEDGAMGLVVNRPMPDIGFAHLLDQLGIETGENIIDIPVGFGGPVEPGRGFVLHRLDEVTDLEDPEGTLRIDAGLAMTSTRDILEDFARGQGPQPALLALGYAGWGPGQLDDEILSNGWLTSDRGDDIIFGAQNDQKWTLALHGLGVDPRLLSSTAGHA